MLELKDICVDVGDGLGILDRVSLRLPEGKFVVVTGPNGGGKSTLAKVIAGILPPTGGQILFDGQDITAAGITERARLGIGYAFQQPVRFKGLTVRDLLTLAAGEGAGPRLGEDCGGCPEDRLCGWLRDVGLCAKDYLDREVDASLSGGEIKRIEIATVMARKTRLAIFDEPEAGIDLWSFGNLVEVFGALRRTPRQAVLLISHQERIFSLADEIVVLAGGRITAQGPRDEVLPGLLPGKNACGWCPQEKGR